MLAETLVLLDYYSLVGQHRKVLAIPGERDVLLSPTLLIIAHKVSQHVFGVHPPLLRHARVLTPACHAHAIFLYDGASIQDGEGGVGREDDLTEGLELLCVVGSGLHS